MKSAGMRSIGREAEGAEGPEGDQLRGAAGIQAHLHRLGVRRANVSFAATKFTTGMSQMGRYRQLTPTRSSQRRGGEGRARGLRPLYLV